MKRRDFNKILAVLPLAGALPFSFVKKAVADVPKTKREPRIFYANKQVEFAGKGNVNWEEPIFDASQIEVYENDIYEPKVMAVSISTDFNLESIMSLGQAALYQQIHDKPEITVSLQVYYEELQVMVDYEFRGFTETEWIHKPDPNDIKHVGNCYYACQMVKVLQHGQDILQFDPNKIPSTRWEVGEPVEMLIDFTDDQNSMSNLFIKELRLASVQYTNSPKLTPAGEYDGVGSNVS